MIEVFRMGRFMHHKAAHETRPTSVVPGFSLRKLKLAAPVKAIFREKFPSLPYLGTDWSGEPPGPSWVRKAQPTISFWQW
jgi:hypothetical protein